MPSAALAGRHDRQNLALAATLEHIQGPPAIGRSIAARGEAWPAGAATRRASPGAPDELWLRSYLKFRLILITLRTLTAIEPIMSNAPNTTKSKTFALIPITTPARPAISNAIITAREVTNCLLRILRRK